MGKDGKPSSECCWRFAFRFHQNECRETDGFMVQVEEVGGLGNGQKIETLMAKDAHLKILRTQTGQEKFKESGLKWLFKAVKKWILDGCIDRSLTEVNLDKEE